MYLDIGMVHVSKREVNVIIIYIIIHYNTLASLYRQLEHSRINIFRSITTIPAAILKICNKLDKIKIMGVTPFFAGEALLFPFAVCLSQWRTHALVRHRSSMHQNHLMHQNILLLVETKCIIPNGLQLESAQTTNVTPPK